MKKYIVIAFALVAQLSMANVVTGVAAIPDGYYDGVNGKKGADNILNALQTCISKDYNEISYKGLEPHYLQTDFYSDTLWDMYSTCRFVYEDANIPQKAVCDGWNKEHVCCQSWLGSGPMVSDMFNVYPTDARINNLRSNYPYGVVGSGFNGFSKDPQHHGLGKLGTSTTSGIGTCYEPDDNYKGDFARTFMYMVARYRNNTLNSGQGAKMFTSNPTNFTEYSLSFLLKWHREDPVSQKEIDRNQAVYGIQHNRNPFIDYPELVEYIWGNKIGQTVDLASMTPTCEGGGYDPTQVTKYGVNWSVCGTVIHTDSIVAGRALTALPETPVSCSATSDVFMGWTTAPIEGTLDHAPLLYKSHPDIPVITADITRLLDEGKILTSPEVNLAGLSSIEVNIRTYGGAQYCNLDVKAGDTRIATIVATNGKTLTDYTWTNTGTFSGLSPLTFSTNYGNQQGIGFTRVVINATGSGITYSAFLTTSGTEDFPSLQAEEGRPVKLLINGLLYIKHGDKIYTITGQSL